MRSNRRTRVRPVPLAPAHHRDWRRLWRYCTCGLRWPCPDRRIRPPGPAARPSPPAGPVPQPDGGAGPRAYPTGSGGIAAGLNPRRRPANRGPGWARDARRHAPLRPLWLCRACAAAWPCPPARLSLLLDHAGDPVGLDRHLHAMLHEALADLRRLNPQPGPDPAALSARFLGWTRPDA